MWKKVISAIAVTAIIAVVLPTSVWAVANEDLISSITLNPTSLPTGGGSLGVTVDFDSTIVGQNVTGGVFVKRGTTTVATLESWFDSTFTAGDNPLSLTWDGTDEIDGDYSIFVTVAGTTTGEDEDTQPFTIGTPLEITAVSADPSTFNPLSAATNVNFTLSDAGFVTAEVLSGATVVRTLTPAPNEFLAAGSHSLPWDGRDTGGATVADGTYTINVSVSRTDGGAEAASGQTTVTVSSAIPLEPPLIFTAIPDSGRSSFDPAPRARDEQLEVRYQMNVEPDNVTVEIRDTHDLIVKNFTSGDIDNLSSPFVWDGLIGNKLAVPGTYTANLTASKAGETSVTGTTSFLIAYDDTRKGELNDFTLLPDDFDPDVEDIAIEFKNTVDTNITVEVQNLSGTRIKGFSGYDNSNYNEDQLHSLTWDGTDINSSKVSVGTYKVVVVTRNDYGVVVRELDVTVNNTGGTVNTSNSHISGVKFSPSSKFEPAKDGEMEIEWDVKVDLDELQIYAVRGTEKIELYDEDDVSEDDDLLIEWDGTDGNDEYASKGTWRIQFESKVGSTSLVAAKSFEIDYEKPAVRDIYLSKTEFDEEIGEFTTIMFRIDQDAEVTIEVLESNSVDDEIEEDMLVEANVWYAVTWDGSGYDEDDDLDIRVTAKNIANDAVYDTEKIAVKVKEDQVASSKSNVTGDFFDPAITDGDTDMVLHYDLEEEADVVVTIHKGTSASGSAVIELLDLNDQEDGSHTVTWDGRARNGSRLAKGVYSYKITAKTGSTETEKGVFVIGVVGDDGGSVSSGSSGTSGSTAPNVLVDGKSIGGGSDDDDDGDTPSGDGEDCGGFPDVAANSPQCAAIQWVEEEGIFQGYPDGTFKQFEPINRVEILKVILEAFDVPVAGSVVGTLGFSDVTVNAWYMPYIKAGQALGIFQGDGGKNTARPAATVNRVEALKLVFETLRVREGYVVGTCAGNYADVKTGDWFYNYTCEAKKYGLFDTFGNSFGGGLLSTRGEMAELFYRLHLAGVM